MSKSFLATFLCAFLSSVAIAQTSPPATLKSLNLSCSDFKQNTNGSWSPLHTVQIGPASIGTGVSFSPGVSFGGVNLAVLLNTECLKH